jgi:hypothetical protein
MSESEANFYEEKLLSTLFPGKKERKIEEQNLLNHQIFLSKLTKTGIPEDFLKIICIKEIIRAILKEEELFKAASKVGQIVERSVDVVSGWVEDYLNEIKSLEDEQKEVEYLEEETTKFTNPTIIRDIPSPSSSVKRRQSILDQFPDILLEASEWVRTRLEYSRTTRTKPFKITEFQEFCNRKLLKDLFYNHKYSIQPISHSTARSWLSRFGYYDPQVNPYFYHHGEMSTRRSSSLPIFSPKEDKQPTTPFDKNDWIVAEKFNNFSGEMERSDYDYEKCDIWQKLSE